LISVLLIDDDVDILDIARIFLERGGGIKVDIASSAIEAFGYLKVHKFDAIVSDYEMPEMTGLDLLRTLKSLGDKTPFIIFTGRGREVNVEAMKCGADFCMHKGGDPKTQFNELRNLINLATYLRHPGDPYHKCGDSCTGMVCVDSQEQYT
jgi:DNA-binding NtrC family response regulator